MIQSLRAQGFYRICSETAIWNSTCKALGKRSDNIAIVVGNKHTDYLAVGFWNAASVFCLGDQLTLVLESSLLIS